MKSEQAILPNPCLEEEEEEDNLMGYTRGSAAFNLVLFQYISHRWCGNIVSFCYCIAGSGLVNGVLLCFFECVVCGTYLAQ
jgi:hypothetical protein